MSQNTEKCGLCGQGVHAICTAAPGYQRGQTFVIYECDGCLSSFASPLEVADSLYDLIYSNIQYVPGYNRYFRYAQDVLKQQNPLAYLSRQEESYWAVAHLLTGRKNAGGALKILEVGCGMGYFSYALHKSDFKVTGIDLSPQAVAWAREHYGPFYECTSLQSLHDRGRKYDVIVMNQLIEHIPDVHQFIAEALSLLSPGGELLITTPNKSAYPAAEWETELPPVHLWWFGEKAMNFIAQRHECDIRFIDFAQYYDSFMRVKTVGSSLLGRKAVFDEQGRILTGQAIPSQKIWRAPLERAGLLELFRRAKMMLLQNEKWQGPRGPICACVLQSGR